MCTPYLNTNHWLESPLKIMGIKPLNEKPGQKTAQNNSTANVAYTVLTYQNLIPVSTTSNLTPPPPNPSSNCYHLTLLKFCHRNVSKCYGCRDLFVTDGYPKEPYDFVIVSKTQRSYVDPKTRQKTMSSDFSNVYFHLNGSCTLKHGSCFTPQTVAVPEELKQHLSTFHKTFLDSLHIFYWNKKNLCSIWWIFFVTISVFGLEEDIVVMVRKKKVLWTVITSYFSKFVGLEILK